MTKYIIGQPGGPAGPFHSIVTSEGRVIALQVASEPAAKLIVAALEAAEKTCEWHVTGWLGLEVYWRSGCDGHHTTAGRDLAEDGYTYCPHCSGKIEVAGQ